MQSQHCTSQQSGTSWRKLQQMIHINKTRQPNAYIESDKHKSYYHFYELRCLFCTSLHAKTPLTCMWGHWQVSPQLYWWRGSSQAATWLKDSQLKADTSQSGDKRRILKLRLKTLRAAAALHLLTELHESATAAASLWSHKSDTREREGRRTRWAELGKRGRRSRWFIYKVLFLAVHQRCI